MDTFTNGVYIKPGIYAFSDDLERKADEGTSLDALVADHIFGSKPEVDVTTVGADPIYKGKSRGVSLRSILGEDDDDDTKRNIQKEWFDYLDNLAFECYRVAQPFAVLPHRKLVTFGLAASNPELWPMCGNWVEDTRVFNMNNAGVKRGVCLDYDRAHSLVITAVAANKTPKVLSAKHEPEWLDVKSEAILRDLNENAELALAHDWDCCWDVGGDE